MPFATWPDPQKRYGSPIMRTATKNLTISPGFQNVDVYDSPDACLKGTQVPWDQMSDVLTEGSWVIADVNLRV